MKDLKKIQEFFSKPLEEVQFTDYSNNELLAYYKNTKDPKAKEELHKRAEKIKGLSRTDVNEQEDHVNPMVAKAYKDYIKAKKDSAADVDFAEDPEKAYRYYSKKLNNTYSTKADRDAIEAILKKKYGSAMEESVNEGIGTIALGVAGGLLLLKVLKFVVKKVVGAVGMNVALPKEKLLEVVNNMVKNVLAQSSGKQINMFEIVALQSYLKDEINAGRITTVKQIVKVIDTLSKKGKNESVNEAFGEDYYIRVRLKDAPEAMKAFDDFIGKNDFRLNKGGDQFSTDDVKAGIRLYRHLTDRLIKVYDHNLPLEDKFLPVYEGGVAGWKKASMSMIKHIQKQLDDMGVKYEMGDTPYAPFKTIYKPINKSDDWYDKFDDLIWRANLRGVVKTSMDEATKDEETKFHTKLDKLVHDTFGKRKGEMEEGELSEAYVPSNIKEFAKRKGISSLVNKVAGWAEKVGARITGGTAIGYNYNTLILDMGYQTADIRIDIEDEEIELYDEPVNSFPEFKRVFMEEESRKQAEHDEETLRREQGLEERISEALDKINEELCPEGKAYIKRRLAAGEKSSAYLSGRAVKVCKGQMKG